MPHGSHNPFFKDPHIHSEPLGKLTCKVYFVKSREFPKTCAAASHLADIWDKDNQSFQTGIDNYTATLEKILQMLDVFIREKSKGTKFGGQRDNYSLLDNCESTLLLLWQIRNVMAHSGVVIDKGCKSNYEKIFQKIKKGTHPIIELPDKLEIDQEFVIQRKDFDKIKDCFFGYIKQRVSKEDYSILARRAISTNFRITGALVYLPINDGYLVFDIRKASAHGIDIDPKTGIFESNGAVFSFQDSKIHLKNGDSFPAKYISKSEYDEKKIPNFEF
jgi:hypothetical protein